MLRKVSFLKEEKYVEVRLQSNYMVPVFVVDAADDDAAAGVVRLPVAVVM